MNKFFLVICAYLALCSCSPHDAQSIVDSSQTPAEAALYGAPPADRPWLPADYVRLASYLNNLPEEASLPRYASEHSGPLFRRSIHSIESPAFLNEQLSLDERISMASRQVTALRQTLLIYVRTHLEKEQDYSIEIAYLLGSSLVSMRQMLLLLNAYIPELDRESPPFAIQMEGLQQVKGGAATAFNGFLVSLTDDTIYENDDFEVFAKYLAQYGGDFLDHLDEDARTEFQSRLSDIARSHPAQCIREAARLIIER